MYFASHVYHIAIFVGKIIQVLFQISEAIPINAIFNILNYTLWKYMPVLYNSYQVINLVWTNTLYSE